MKYLVLAGALFALSSCVKDPVACFEAQTETIVCFEPASFSATCSENTEDYDWTFEGDQKTTYATEESPTFVWGYPGNYSVTLEVRSKNNSRKDEITKIIQVEDVCWECVHDLWGPIIFCASQWQDGDAEAMLQNQVAAYELQNYTCAKAN